MTPKRAEATCLIARVMRLAVRTRLVPGRVLAALAGVRGAAEAPHPDRQRLVRLGAERAEAHGAERRTGAAMRARGLDLVERHRRCAAGRSASWIADVAGSRASGRRRSAGAAVAAGRRSSRRRPAPACALTTTGARRCELAVAPEADEARVGQPDAVAGGRRPGGVEPAISRSAESPRSRSGPATPAAAGKQRSTTSGASPIISNSWLRRGTTRRC